MSDLNEISIEHIYEFILRAIVDNNDVGFENSCLYDYLQKVFGVDATFHKELLKLAYSPKPAVLGVNVKCIEAVGLKATSGKKTGNYLVSIFKTTSPELISSTQILFETTNPKWMEEFFIPIEEGIENDEIVFEVFDCTDVDEVGSLHGLKTIVNKVTQSGCKTKKLVGSAKILIKSIKHGMGFDDWIHLEKRGNQNNRGKINIKVRYSTDKPRNVALEEYQFLIHHLLMYELKESRVANYWWDGKFSELGEVILQKYFSRVHLSKLDDALSKWNVFSKVHVKQPLSFILFNAMLNTFSNLIKNDEPNADLKCIWEGAACLLQSCLTEIHHQIANKRHDATLNVVLNIMAKLQHLADRSSERIEVFNFSIKKALEDIMVNGANDRFKLQLAEQNISMITDCENIIKIKVFVDRLHDDLSEGSELNEIFFKIINLYFTETVFLVYDEKLTNILENILNKTDDEWKMYCATDKPEVTLETKDKHITLSLFQLYLTLKKLLALGSKITVSEVLKLNGCETWFKYPLRNWIDLTVKQSERLIETAINKDNFELEHSDANYSSSAVDTLAVFCQIKQIWGQLEWTDDAGSIMIIGKINDGIYRLFDFYSNRLQSSLGNRHLNTKHTQGNIYVIEQWCLVIKNMEYIWSKFSTFTNEIHTESMATLISNLNNSFADKINEIKNKIILQSVTTIIRYMSSTIRCNLTMLVQTQNFKTKSIDEMFEYIDRSVTTLRSDMNSNNFEKVIDLLWDEVSIILEDIVVLAVKTRNRLEFYSDLQLFLYNIVRLVTTVEISKTTFTKDCPKLLYIDNLLKLNALETPHLIHQYHLDRARSQNDPFNAKNAILTVRCHFNINDLIIEIINARNLETVLSNTNRKCNPVVKVHLLPLKKENISYQTKLQKNTTVPLIDEKCLIKLDSTESKCDRLVLFTVWNVSKTEEFLGECYMALRNIPDSYVEKQTHLNLSRSSDVTQLTLKVLKARRRYDKEAQIFLNYISTLKIDKSNFSIMCV